MNTQSVSSFDSTCDFYQIGLMAAASPEFAEAMIRTLLGAGEGSSIARESTDALRHSSVIRSAAA
jgi:hypothetical protein